MRNLITRIALVIGIGAAAALALAMPAMAATACTACSGGGVQSTVTVAPTITLSVGVTSVDYGQATGAAQLPVSASGGSLTGGGFTVDVSTSDGAGMTLGVSAPDWASGSLTFPASSLAPDVIPPVAPGTPLTEGSGSASNPDLYGTSGPGTWNFAMYQFLNVPGSVAAATTPYQTTVTYTATAS